MPRPSADEIRAAQRATWAGLSAGWERWDSVITEQLGPVGAAMIERLDISQGQRHLDIASGTGEPGLSISKLAPNAVAALQQVDEPARERIRATAIANVGAFERDGKVRVPGLARCIVGTK